MPKCKKCGKELELSGFEEDEEGNRIELYSCQNEECPKKRDQIRGEETHEVWSMD